jgi:hypothetical protein
MSEAELHILKARMLEGRRAKARRGELGKPVPMGYLRHPSGEIVFDPDEQAQATIRLVFDLFERFRTVGKVLRYLVEHDVRMPVRVRSGPHKGDLEWRRVSRPSLSHLFTNPIYAGAYVYGVRRTDRRRQKPGRAGSGRSSSYLEDADVFLPDRVPAYISWEQYERNRAQMRRNMTSAMGPVRAGTALLSGVLICGRCGLRMNAHYNNNGHTARYSCVHMKTNYDEPFCQSLKAAPLDTLVTRLVLQALQPAALETSIALSSGLAANILPSNLRIGSSPARSSRRGRRPWPSKCTWRRSTLASDASRRKPRVQPSLHASRTWRRTYRRCGTLRPRPAKSGKLSSVCYSNGFWSR